VNDEARALLESGALAHLATVNPDGSPQVTVIWVGVEGDKIVSAHLFESQKIRNIRRDPRVVLSIQGEGIEPPGLHRYMLVHAHARITEGRAAEVLQRLAHTYLGPDVTFPAMDDPPPGFVVHYTVDRFGGVGAWGAP
jgi:PPOX class probable F420-dependent enzyme